MAGMDPSNKDPEVWWFICTLCHRAYNTHTLLLDYKSRAHNRRGTSDTLILSQVEGLAAVVKIRRCCVTGGRESKLSHNGGDPSPSPTELDECASPSLTPTRTCVRSTSDRADADRAEKLKDDTTATANKALEASPPSTRSNHRPAAVAPIIKKQPNTCKICGKPFPNIKKLKQHALLVHVPDSTPSTQTQVCDPDHKPTIMKEEPEPASHQDQDGNQVEFDYPDDDNGSEQSTNSEGGELDPEPADDVEVKEEETQTRTRRSGKKRYKRTDNNSSDSDCTDKKAKTAPTYNCPICPSTFKHKIDVGIHADMVHTPEQDRTCSICKRVYLHWRRLVIHVREVHSKTPDHICHKCGKSFNTPRFLKAHAKVHEKNLPCDICSRPCFSKTQLAVHRLTHGAPQFACSHCNMKLKSAQTLKSHIMYKHSELRQFRCDKCGLGCKTKEQLHNHLRTHSEASHPCDKCGAVFKTSLKLDSHIKRVHAHSTHSCRVCSLHFPKLLTAVRHEIQAHSFHRPVNVHTCHICGKIYLSKQRLDVHIAHHGKEKGYVCDCCGKSFKSSANLFQHSYTHLSYSEFKNACGVCGKRFKHAAHLRQHERGHQREQSQGQLQPETDAN